MMARSVCLGAWLLLLGSVHAQSGVTPLRSSSDAGQRTYDQRIRRSAMPTDTTVYETMALDVAPVYPGGDTALFNQLAKAPGCQPKGWNANDRSRTKVTLRFVIELNGKISQIRTEGEADDTLQRYAICAAGTLLPFTPGKKEGMAVRTLIRMPLQYEPR